MSLAGETKDKRILIFAGAALVFIVFALVVRGMTLEVEYQRVLVTEVIQVPGQTMSDRLVVVDLGDRQRPILTSDRLLKVEVGETACLAKRKVIFRKWARYSLELPGYCRNG